MSEATAVLPRGWRRRLLPFQSVATGGVTAYCLEPHDLWIAKAIATRDQDIEFCEELVREGIVGRKLLETRLRGVPRLDRRLAQAVRERIARASD